MRKKYYHAATPETMEKIIADGVVKRGWDGCVYLCEKPQDAAKFVAIRGHDEVAVIEVILPANKVKESFDHSVQFFQCKAFMYEEDIKVRPNAEVAEYGWLEPDGTFHGVEWGEHQEWAQNYMNEKFPKEAMDGDIDLQTKCNVGLIGAGDWLVERGWVLLHNPSQGIAFPTKNPVKEYTKAQKEFLYDYYMERDCKKEANAIWQEDE